MYLLTKHLLSTTWVPAPVLRAQNTVIAGSSTQRLGRRGQARGREHPCAQPPLSFLGPRWACQGPMGGCGDGGLLPVSGEAAEQTPAGRPIPARVSRRLSAPDPAPHHTRAGSAPSRTLGPLEGLPSLTREVRSICLSRWSAGGTAEGKRCQVQDPRGTPQPLPGRQAPGPGRRLPTGRWALEKQPPRPFADTPAHAGCAPSPSSRNLTWGELPRPLTLASDTFLGVPGGLCTPLDRRWCPLPAHGAP